MNPSILTRYEHIVIPQSLPTIGYIVKQKATKEKKEGKVKK